MLHWFETCAYTTKGSQLPYETIYNFSDGNIGAQFGRGGPGFQFRCYLVGAPGFMVKSLPFAKSTFWQGKPVRIDAIGNGLSFMGLMDNGTMQVSYRFDSAGHVLAVLGDPTGTPTPLCISTTTYAPGTFLYVEAKTVLNATTGSIQIWVNGVKVAGVTGVNTLVTSKASANQEYVGITLNSCRGGSPCLSVAGGGYILDTTGAAPWNTRLGDCSGLVIMPAAPGSFAQFIPSDSSKQNFDIVDNIPPGVAYNYSNLVGARDSFAVGDIAPGIDPQVAPDGAILAVMPMPFAGNDAAGMRAIAAIARQAGTDKVLPNAYLGVGPAYALGTSAANPNNIMQTDVHALAWTPDNFNATEIGYEVTV